MDQVHWVPYDKDWKDHEDIWLICPHCNRRLNRFGEGRWFIRNPQSKVSGYHFSRLFTGTSPLTEIYSTWVNGQRDFKDEIISYNSNFGLPYSSDGARITLKSIQDAQRDYKLHNPKTSCILGCDLGSVQNVCIAEMVECENRVCLRVVYAGIVDTEEDILHLYTVYNCVAGVIDSLPDDLTAKRIVAQTHALFRAYYTQGKKDTVDMDNNIVNLNRTSAITELQKAIELAEVQFPRDIFTVEYFEEQMTASTKVYDPEKGRYDWKEGHKDDHYMHAMTYMLQAYRLLLREEDLFWNRMSISDVVDE